MPAAGTPSYADLATAAGAPPGSGANFRALKGQLASRGASNPGALAAWIGRKKYGRKGMARLSAHGRAHSHAWPSYAGIALAAGGDEDNRGNDDRMTCPQCGHSGPASAFGAGGASLDKSPSELRTPSGGDVAGSGFSPGSAGINVRSGAGGAGLSNGSGRDIRLAGAGGLRRLPVTGPMDVMITRGGDGQAVIRHRHGGGQIAVMRRDGAGWVATVDGHDLAPRAHQRTSLMEAVSTYNRTATTALRPGMPLQGPPEQTQLMQQYGIPAIRALATPATSASGGARVTVLNGSGGGGDDGTDDDGLTPRGQAIRDRLKKKGFPHDRATLFARRSQNTRPGQFGQAAS